MARRVRFWDLAATARPDADFTAGVRMSCEGRLFYVEDLIHGRWTPQARDAVILQTAKLDGRSVPVVIEQEPGAAGVAQVAALVSLLAGFRVSGRRSTGDKVTRAGPLASQAEAGNVKLVEGTWNRVWLDEIAAFPEGEHDDIVDATAGAFLVIAEPISDPLLGAVIGRGVKGW
jgi:predicted phage terminase large subunit-like protein